MPAIHFLNNDPLRDPLWQFVFGVLALILPLGGIVLRLLFKKDANSMIAEPPLGCGGVVLLFLLRWGTAYGLYLVLLRILIPHYAGNRWVLFAASAAAVWMVTFVTSWAVHKRFSLVLTFQSCTAVVMTAVILYASKTGTIVTKDFTFAMRYLSHLLAQSLPDLKDLPLAVNVRAVPIDMTIPSPTKAAPTFFWIYGTTLLFSILAYILYTRTIGQRAAHWENLSAKSRQALLENLKKEDKEATIQLKRKALQEKNIDLEEKKLELEKKRVMYALELAGTLTDTLHPGVDPATRAAFIAASLQELLHAGDKESKTTSIILGQLNHTLAPSLTRPQPPPPSPTTPPAIPRIPRRAKRRPFKMPTWW
jgi:hypothetical protein